MVQITIDGDIQFSKKHFKNIEELILEITLLDGEAFQKKDFIIPEYHKKMLEERLANAEKNGYKKGYSREEFMEMF
ncbi:hypothetical protein [Tenacibaculum xiamenense]|uniref:hypothetical protein n=1 Tax=Tenacibaculum xiamenense TaxID=1261553 RepID=UPI003894C209